MEVRHFEAESPQPDEVIALVRIVQHVEIFLPVICRGAVDTYFVTTCPLAVIIVAAPADDETSSGLELIPHPFPRGRSSRGKTLQPAETEIAGITAGVLADDLSARSLMPHLHHGSVGADEIEIAEKAEKILAAAGAAARVEIEHTVSAGKETHIGGDTPGGNGS